jgi:hypothetical protein
MTYYGLRISEYRACRALHFVPWHPGSGCLGAAAPVTGAAADEYNLNVVDCNASVTVARRSSISVRGGLGGTPSRRRQTWSGFQNSFSFLLLSPQTHHVFTHFYCLFSDVYLFYDFFRLCTAREAYYPRLEGVQSSVVFPSIIVSNICMDYVLFTCHTFISILPWSTPPGASEYTGRHLRGLRSDGGDA